MTDLDALAFPANQWGLHTAVVHPQDPALANQLHVIPTCQSIWHWGLLAACLRCSLGMEKAEHHIPLEDVEVPGDHRFTLQDLHNYLNKQKVEFSHRFSQNNAGLNPTKKLIHAATSGSKQQSSVLLEGLHSSA